MRGSCVLGKVNESGYALQHYQGLERHSAYRCQICWGIIRVSNNTHALASWRGFRICGSLSRLVYFTISMWGNLKLAYKYLEAWLPNGKDSEHCWLQILTILWPLDVRRKPEGRARLTTEICYFVLGCLLNLSLVRLWDNKHWRTIRSGHRFRMS